MLVIEPLHGNLYLEDRKSTRLNSSHLGISYAVFCLNKKIITLMKNTRKIHKKNVNSFQHIIDKGRNNIILMVNELLAFFVSMQISLCCLFFFNDTATTEIYTLSLHELFRSHVDRHVDRGRGVLDRLLRLRQRRAFREVRSEEHTSELQSLRHLVCRLLLE